MPSKEGQKRHLEKLREIVKKCQAQSQGHLIKHLNPLIRGWSNYYQTVCSKETFVKVYSRLHLKLKRWAHRRHSGKSKGWIESKYWRRDRKKSSRFAPKETPKYELIQHSDTKIVRHVKVQGSRSPFDGNWVYWSARLGHFPGVTSQVARLLKRQQGKCSWCKSHLHAEDVKEVDHITPRKLGGKRDAKNLQLMHRHCHDIKTAQDLERIREFSKMVKAEMLQGIEEGIIVRAGKPGVDYKSTPGWGYDEIHEAHYRKHKSK
jgi:RNA-directed DNA polymerase